jgi:hypothetical protein
MIDPNIALQVKPVQVDNPMDAYGRVLAIKGAVQHGQLQAEQLKGAQAANAQRERDLTDDEIVKAAWGQTGGDLNRILPLVSGKVSAKKQEGLVKFHQDARLKAAQIKKEDLPVLVDQNDRLLTLIEQVKATPDQEYEAKWPSFKAAALSIKPDLNLPDQAPPKTEVGMLSYGLVTSGHYYKQEQEKRLAAEEARKAEEHKAKLPGVIADALGKGLQVAGQTAPGISNQAGWDEWRASLAPEVAKAVPAMFSPAAVDLVKKRGMTPEQQVATAETATRNAEIAKRDSDRIELERKRVGLEGQRVGLERQRFNATIGAGLDANGQALPADALKARAAANPAAVMMTEGKMSPQTARSMLRKNPALLAQARALDPNFDEADIENRFATLKEFTNTSNGKAGGQALALNTLIHHADLYMETAEALKNETFKPGNAVYNKVADAFGSAPPTNAALVARFFAGETGKVATGGVPAEGEINGILKNLSTDAGPDQIAGAGKTLLQIAAGRATPLIEKVNGAKLQNVVRVIGPDAKEILGRRGFNADTMKPAAAATTAGAISVTDPSGGVHTFKTQAEADNFKKLANIK